MSVEREEGMGAAVSDYLRALEARGLAPSTVDRRRHTLGLLSRALARLGVRCVLEMERGVLVAAVARVCERAGPNARAHRVWEVRHFTRWLAREGRTLGDAGAALPRARRGPQEIPRRVPSEEEVARLYRATEGVEPAWLRDRALLEVLYGGGLRRAEAVALDVRDLDAREGLITVRRGKGGKSRVVPLPRKSVETLVRYVREARPILLRRKHDGGALFVGERGRPLRRLGLWRVVRALGERAGVSGLAPHALRHAIATHLLRAGASIRHVQLLLGHAQIRTTAIYTHLTRRDLARALERAHPRERGGRRRKA